MSGKKATPRTTHTSKEQQRLYESFLDGMAGTTTSSGSKRKAAQEHNISLEDVSPSKTPKVVDPTMPVLSKAGGKESSLPTNSQTQDVVNMPAEEYFEKFKQFLVQNELFVVPKSRFKESQQGNNPMPSIVDNQNEPVSSDTRQLGPEVSKRIVDMIMNFLARNRKAENIENLVSSFPRPSNLPCMQSPKLNKSVYLKISGNAQKFDVKCRKLQDILNASSSALVRALQTLVDNEHLKKEISEAGIQVKQALKLLAFANRDLNDRRKDSIRNSINPMYLSLLSYDKSPSLEWLLGDNIDSDMDELDKVKKQSERLVKPQASGSSQGRRRGYYRNDGRQSESSRQPTSDRRDSQSQRPQESQRNDSVRYNRSSSSERTDFQRRPYQTSSYRYYPRNRRRY